MPTPEQYILPLLEGRCSEPDSVIQQCHIFIHELLKWNSRVNLTSITDIAECWEKHIQDAYLVLGVLPQHGTLLDMGSGAGIPAIPIKIACPEIDVCSVDKVRKKINFQNHCKRLLGLTGFRARPGRVEMLLRDGGFDVVIARAVAPLETLIKMGAPHVKKNAILVAMKGRIENSEIDTGSRVAQQHDMAIEAICKYDLLPSKAERNIIVVRKYL